MLKKIRSSFKGWKILWKYLSVYRRELIILSFVGVFSAIANGSIPYIAGKFFDAILKPQASVGGIFFEIPLWASLLALWAFGQVIAIVTDWYNERTQVTLGDRTIVDYRAHAAEVLLSLPLAFHKGKKHGEIMETINRASNSIYTIVSNIIIRLAPQFLSIVIGLGFVFSMNVHLALILLVGIISYVFVLFRTVPSVVPLQRKSQKKWNKAYNALSQATANLNTVKQFSAEAYEYKKIRTAYLSAYSLGVFLRNIWSNLSFSQRIIVAGTQLFIFITSVQFIHVGMMSIGELLAFNGYALIAFSPFVALGNNWRAIQSGLVSIERAEKILSEKPEEYSPQGSVKNFEFQGAIKFDNVSFGYKKGEIVLDGVNFETKPGQLVALVGESGAGKSTLVDLISGYYFPSGGKVLIDNRSIKKLDLHFLRQHIAIVSQEIFLFHDSIKKNIAYGLMGLKDEAIRNAATVAHADKFIEKFSKKYETIVGERGVKLSVGQKQRIAIARAILRDPKILILDEPTSALDSETEKYVTEALDKVMAGRTTFVIAHRLSTVRKADKILVLENGKIIEQGTHDELMAIEGGNYRRRYELHVGLV